jgi:hypothetical protein
MICLDSPNKTQTLKQEDKQVQVSEEGAQAAAAMM